MKMNTPHSGISMSRRGFLNIGAAAATASVLAACGGGGGDQVAATTPVTPVTAPVTPVNHAPTFASANTSSSVTLMSEPAIISLPRATDTDSGDTLIHTVSNLPTGVTYDPTTHSISISPTTTPNTYTIIIVATDKKGASATMTVSLEVVDPAPVAGGAFAALADMTVSDQAGAGTITINTGGVTDTLGRTIAYSASGLPNDVNGILTIDTSTGVISGVYDVLG